MDATTSRRDLLLGAAALGAGFWVSPRNAWALSRSPNEALRIAVIGAGGRGASDTRELAAAGAQIVALCDVDDERAKGTYESFPKARRFVDYREMLEKMDKEIDAVLIATPDHMHAPQTMMAMRLGKHVYTQKPLTHNIHEARLLTQTSASRGIVSQMGNQGAASPRQREAIEVIRSGAIGPVREVHVWTDRPIWPRGVDALMAHHGVRSSLRGPSSPPPVPRTLNWDLWLGCAAERAYDKIYVPFSWRGWWDFGTGALGDMACHIWNMPWHALHLDAPTAVEAQVAPDVNDETCPSWSVVTYAFPARGERPAVKLVWYDGGRKRPEWVSRRLAELTQSEKPPGNGAVCIGDKGRLVWTYGGGLEYRLLPESDFAGFKPPDPTLPRVPNHFVEWIRACIDNRPDAPISNFATAGPLTEAILLGCVAIRTRQRLEWDAANLKVTNVPEANRFLTREYRKGFEL